MLMCSDDYASLGVKGFHFYFGYEVEDEAGNWAFEAKFPNGQKVLIPRRDIEARSARPGDPPEMFLLGGIALLFERGLVTVP